jgi:hypothetical protein
VVGNGSECEHLVKYCGDDDATCVMCCICTQVEVHIENNLLIVCSIVQLRYFFGLLFILC